MKKLFSLIVFAIAFSLILTACSSSTSSSGGKSNGSKTLNVWAWNINVPVLKNAEKEYAKTHPGFKLKVQDIANADVYSKLTTALQAGGQGLPDIVLVEDTMIQGYLDNFPKAFVNLSKKGFDKYADKFPQFKKDILTKDGNVYGFPFDAGPAGIFYRTDIFKQAGVDPSTIKTWDDFIVAGKTVKAKTGVPLIGQDSADDGLYRITLNQQGAYYFTKDGKIDFTSDASKNSMELEKKMMEAGIVKVTTGWDAGMSALLNGKVAASVTGCWMAGLISQQAPNLKGKWAMMPLPAFAAGGNTAADLGGSNWVIPSSSQNQDLAYNFLKFFSTTNSTQEMAMKGGLFPTLNTVYNSPLFTSPDEYFSNQTIWKTFADETKDIPSVTYTANYNVAHDEAVKARSEILTSHKDISASLEAAVKRFENRTK